MLFQRGKQTQADFLSRKATPFYQKLPKEQQTEADDLQKLLYILHTTPIMDHIGLGNIAKATMDDPVLSQIQVLL